MSAQALAELEALHQQAAALHERYIALDQQRESLEAQGQASQDVAEVRRIADQIAAMYDQFSEIWNTANDLDTRAAELEQQVNDYVAELKQRFDDTNNDAFSYADTVADSCQETASDFEQWADDVDEAMNAGRAGRSYA